MGRPSSGDTASEGDALRRASSIDNREAMAYVIFSRFSCTRDYALATVDEIGGMLAAKRWRSRKRPTTHLEKDTAK